MTQEGNSIRLKVNTSAARAVDLFFFDDVAPHLLDSYQQVIGEMECNYFLSGTGDKIVVALPAVGDIYARAAVSRLEDLYNEVFTLENDSPEAPFGYGFTRLAGGASRTLDLKMNPLLCSIRVRSVSCDFRGRPYSENIFHNDNLFLINSVSQSCPLAAEGGHPVSWTNYGFPSSKHPFLFTEGCGDVGLERVYPQAALYCYPNPAAKPPTRLVLEGHVGDVHCYYPIDIPLGRGGMSYNLDITLLRMGTDYPDCTAAPGTYTVDYTTVPWYESEEREEIY